VPTFQTVTIVSVSITENKCVTGWSPMRP